MKSTHLILITSLMSAASCLPKRSVDAPASEADARPVFMGISRVTDITESSATLEWAGVEGVSYYSVYRIDGDQEVHVANVPRLATSYELESLDDDTEYVYWVRAIYSDSRVDENEGWGAFRTEPRQLISAVLAVDFADASQFAYQNQKISLGAELAKLIAVVGGTYSDDFSDGSTDNWATAISYSSSELTSVTESLGAMVVQSTGLLIGLPFAAAANLTRATASVTVTPKSFSGTPLVGILARQSGNAYYLGTTYGSKHRILYNNGTTLSSLGTVDTAALAINTAYNMKLQANGSQLKYKMWVDGQAEPSWLVTVTNTLLSSGKSGVVSAGGRSDFEMFEVADETVVGGGALYPTEGVALTMPELDFSAVGGELQSYDELIVGENSYTDAYIRYELSTNSGATWLVPVGDSWQANAAGASGAVSLASINAKIAQLPVTSQKLKIRAYLFSTTGARSPEIFATSIRYSKL